MHYYDRRFPFSSLNKERKKKPPEWYYLLRALDESVLDLIYSSTFQFYLNTLGIDPQIGFSDLISFNFLFFFLNSYCFSRRLNTLEINFLIFFNFFKSTAYHFVNVKDKTKYLRCQGWHLTFGQVGHPLYQRILIMAK